MIRHGMYSSQIYGNATQRFKIGTKAIDAINEAQSDFTKIDEQLNIDFENEDLTELTDYLEKNVTGFELETCELKFINNFKPGTESYDLLYRLQYNGFDTNYSIYVVKDEEGIKYSSNLDEFRAPREAISNSEDITEDIINKAKKEALENAGTDCTMDYQTVEKKLDDNFKPYLEIKTVFIDEYDAYFTTGYTYNLEL